ncbi:hypothetical protein J6590_040184 [Homalodisca vitripennis]|nr:hypothetical protein J6590_040184 [Homalodisca vitripennis]
MIMYCLSKCVLVRGREIHQYETRDRDNFRTQQHRLTLSQHLPQQRQWLDNAILDGRGGSGNEASDDEIKEAAQPPSLFPLLWCWW